MYHSITDINKKLDCESKGDLFVLHFNIVSLVLHKDAIASTISRMKVRPDVICVSESRLRDDKIEWQLKMVDIPNYKLVYDNSKTAAGGAAIYISEKIKNLKVMSELKLKVDDCESVFIEMYFDKKNLTENTNAKQTVLLGCIYRHPRYATPLFVSQLLEKLSIYSEKNIPIILVGDMNIDAHDKSDRTINYLNALSSVGCKNLIDVPTCFDKGSQSCLDHVITNVDHNNITYGALDTTPTNHLPVYAIYKNGVDKCKNQNDEVVKWRYIDDRKKELFLTFLEENLSSIDLNDHPEKILEALTKATQKAIDHCFPLKEKSNRAKKRSLTPWYDSEIFKGDKTQRRLFRRFIKTNTAIDHQVYKNFRKELSKKKYRAKKTYFQNLLKEAKNSEDKRATWKVITRVFGKKEKKRICPDKVEIGDPSNPSVSECPKVIANVLNSHFTNVAKALAENLEKTDSKHTDFMGRENLSTMYLKYIELSEILKEIKKMCVKKAMGLDEIAPKIIKWAPELFAPILLVIFNKCIELGYYPGKMKIGQVAPVHKKGDQDEKNNYRPITVLTQFNQIFERLLSKRFISFFEKYDIITKKQFGFLKKHCTEHAILDLKEYLMNKIDRKKIIAVLFLDLQKAFDTVDHEILLQKLYHYGVRGKAYKLLKSYLSGRTQRTKVRNVFSELASVSWGVPQGSVLGPLLFLIFINDLPSASDLCPWLFADDTALALSSDSIRDLENRFNCEVKKVHNWLLANRLSVHYMDKTQFMLVQAPNKKNRAITSSNFKLFMGDHEIERTDNYKYLGILIDDKLSWDFQVKKLCSKLSSICGVLSKVRHYLDRESLMLIYNSLFDSHLRYGILAWGTTSEQNLSKLRVLQNRAVRLITFSSFTTPAAPLYTSLKILPLNEMLFLQKSIFMHSLHFNTLPYALKMYCQKPEHSYPTRYKTSKNYVLPNFTTNRGQSSIKYTGPKAWAEIPTLFKDIAYRKPFSKKLKEHILRSIYVDMPQKLPNTVVVNYFDDLRALFESNDEEGEFFGFINDPLSALFVSEDEEGDFYGFRNDSPNEELAQLFQEDDSNAEFFGF